MLSICTTVKNRSIVRCEHGELKLFPNCVDSIIRARGAIPELELIVADWESNDWPLEQWLYEKAGPIPVRIVRMSGTFSRGRGLNAAAAAAHGEFLFFLDADALVSEAVLQSGISAMQEGKAYFPILYSFNEPEHLSGYWRESGFGHCMIKKDVFGRTGGWPEYKSWGLEDDHFWAKVNELCPVVRETVEGFYHQWHPEEIDFKNQFGEETDAIRDVRARAEQQTLEVQAVRRLRGMLSDASCLILVDEDRTDIKDGLNCRVFPFLERDGRYWGPPTDDAQAIRELERMRESGAELIAFPWVSKWWLEHYQDFVPHLERTAQCLEKSELLSVYRLH
jgi:glycosyltransferase involved in cell wall biosynthesis